MVSKGHKTKDGNKRLFCRRGQVLIEFTFCMIVVFLMIYGLAKVFVWTGRDFAERANAHDKLLVSPIDEDYGCKEWEWQPGPGGTPVAVCLSRTLGPLEQIDPYYYTPISMNAIFGEE
ncbi:MAG TPA: hypothetical protein PKV41_02915 [Candidatus Omnitrophota bacterium]|nr:hypothetical protein [Candidatus Omnitrophota bacterium]